MLTEYNTTFTQTRAVMPAYAFRSTSTYTPIVGQASYLSDGSGPISGPHREGTWSWDTPPTDDPIGVVPATPVGSPLALLVPLLFYLIIKKKSTTRS